MILNLGRALNSMIGVFIRKRRRFETNIEEKNQRGTPYEDRGREWNDVSTNQGMLRMTSNLGEEKLGGRHRMNSP